MHWALLWLQVFHVAFLALHDWIPLGRLNDTRAVRAANQEQRLLGTTLVSTAPYLVGLAGCVWHRSGQYPGWLTWWLWISYGILFYGELSAWWIPYFVGTNPDRVARYRVMFGNTHSLLRERNGIRPNTLHVILHAATLLTLVSLGMIALR